MRRTRGLIFMAGLFAGFVNLAAPAWADDAQRAATPQQEPLQQQAPAQQDPAQQQPDQQGAVQQEQPQAEPAQPQVAAPPSYNLNKFVVDDKDLQIGDIIQDRYRTKPYEIVEWQKRHLPAPQENSHWTYASGNYLMITNDTGKILYAISGDIFFSNN